MTAPRSVSSGSSGSSVSSGARSASAAVSAAVPGSVPGWLSALGRAGYTAKGVVYCLVGVLAALAAFGEGGSVGGSKNAIVALGQQPFGRVLLALVALGLACYVVWRLVQAIADPGNEGSDGKGVAKRLAYVVSGLVHIGIAVFAGSLALGMGSAQAASAGGASASGAGGASGSAGGEGSTADWTAMLMQQPFGLWLVGIAGAIVVAYGLRQLQGAWKASFVDRYRTSEMELSERRAAKRLGQAGLAARGVVLVMIGVFLVQAALRADPSESRGLGGALATLAAQPYGAWLLAAVALGLVAYGLFCFSYARYRDFARS